MRVLFVLLLGLLVAIFFAYPPLIEESDGECGALEQRIADLASHDSSGRLLVSPLYGSSTSNPSGAAFARDRYPLLPASLGCAVAYWKFAISPPDLGTSTADAPSSKSRSDDPARPGNRVIPVLARDITPNGDPISSATIFTLPMEAVAIRVDYPGGRTDAARFQLFQGKAVLSSCRAEYAGPGTAWCKFNVSLRKGNYSIAFTANNVLLGHFPFTVIGR